MVQITAIERPNGGVEVNATGNGSAKELIFLLIGAIRRFALDNDMSFDQVLELLSNTFKEVDEIIDNDVKQD